MKYRSFIKVGVWKNISHSAVILVAFAMSWATFGIPNESHNNFDVKVSAILDFSAPANGGWLYIVNLFSSHQAQCAIETLPGQSAELITSKLQEEILVNNFRELMPSVLFPVNYDGSAYRIWWTSMGRISLYGGQGEIVVGGTETGLGILAPVGSTSGGYDAGRNKYTIRYHLKEG